MSPKRHTTLASIPRPVLSELLGEYQADAIADYYRFHPLVKKLTGSKPVMERRDAKLSASGGVFCSSFRSSTKKNRRSV